MDRLDKGCERKGLRIIQNTFISAARRMGIHQPRWEELWEEGLGWRMGHWGLGFIHIKFEIVIRSQAETLSKQ